jgi:hypothetical protein
MFATTLSNPEALVIRIVSVKGHRRDGEAALVKAATSAASLEHIQLGLLFCDGKEEGFELAQTRCASRNEKTEFLRRSHFE